MKLTQKQIDRIRMAHELTSAACCELVQAHREPGLHSPDIAALQRASGGLSAVSAVLGAILRKHDDDAKAERWRLKLVEQNSGARE